MQAAVVAQSLPWRSTTSDAINQCHLFWMAGLTVLLLLQNTLLTLQWSHAALMSSSALLSCSRRQLPLWFLVNNIYLNCFCLVNVYAFTAFTALWFPHSQMKHMFHHSYNMIGKNYHYLCGMTLKHQSQRHCPYFLYTCEHFSEPVSRYGLW